MGDARNRTDVFANLVGMEPAVINVSDNLDET